MKHKSEEIEGVKINYVEYDLDDLIAGLDYLPAVLDAHLTKEEIRLVAFEYFKMICEDLIMNNNCYVFPGRNIGFITIKNIYNRKYPKLDTTHWETHYQPTITGRVFNESKNIYMVRFTGKTEELFQAELKMHHEYYPPRRNH